MLVLALHSGEDLLVMSRHELALALSLRSGGSR
jgi:hypothetical protein